MPTRYHAKYFAHEISRRHSSGDSERLAGALLDAQVDLNPHQLEAALFAFRSPLSKGAILADEVGLGKTIEAGLVLSQKWAEGKRRILIVTPASLRKQWTQEMAEKFFLPTVIFEAKNYGQLVKNGVRRPFEIADSIVVCSYQFAAKRADELMLTRWDLVVMDEAHRLRNVYRSDNRIGNALKRAFSNIPKLLLTATPLQNSLLELYGLVSIVDAYAFGDVKSFKARFTKLSVEGSFDELKERLKPIIHRTLRRQVLEYIRYTNRIPITEEFVPSDDETALYEMVSEYLRRETLHALPNSQRQLTTLILRKLLASSTFAIAGALDTLANKLKRQLREDATVSDKVLPGLEEDFEEHPEYDEEWDEAEEGAEPEKLTPEEVESVRSEITALEDFRDLAVSISENAKGAALVKALRIGFLKAVELGGAEKAIVFTESRRTQEYVLRTLSENGYAGKIVLFNGTNSDQDSKETYSKWVAANSGTDKVTGSRTADMRAALVDRFRDSAQIMIATEAAAEGINLQFCSIVVNYDLPWNPQRIEQRIGRCHRYGQKHDVVVVNFLNRANAADKRVFELLSEKFKLFSGVFGASDEVLGVIESGVEFEKRIALIYQNCRTKDEIESEFNQLREEMESQIDRTMEDTRRKLLENFDAEVHDRLRVNLKESHQYLSKFERMLWAVTKHELAGAARFESERLRFELLDETAAGFASGEIPKGWYELGKSPEGVHRYRLGHALAQNLIARAANRALPVGNLTFDYTGWEQKAAALVPLVGKSGFLRVEKLAITGSDAQDHMILAAVSDDGHVVDEAVVRRFFEVPSVEGRAVSAAELDGRAAHAAEIAGEKKKKEILAAVALKKAEWFDEEIEKLNGWADDGRRGLKADLKEFDDLVAELKKEARAAQNLPEKLAFQRKLRDVDRKRDEAWKAYDAAAREVEKKKDQLLDEVQEQLEQEVSSTELFSLRWNIV